MPTVILVLAGTAFIVTIACACTARVPVWVPVLLLTVIELLRQLPKGN